MDKSNAIVIGIAICLMIGVATVPLWMGLTFGQRCDKAYPNSTYLERAQCVSHLHNSGNIWEVKFVKAEVIEEHNE